MIKKFTKYAPSKISAKDVEIELLRNKEDFNRFIQSFAYYHGNVERTAAEKILKDYYLTHGGSSSPPSQSSSSLEGLFLLRKCSASPDDFSLSLLHKGQFYHYRICHTIDAYYVLDEGPVIHGLDELVRHHQIEPHGLPCRLSAWFVPAPTAIRLPATARLNGITNPLHLACASLSEVNKVKLILKSPNRPDINEKDDNGRTALHIAAEYDNIGALEELIEANALVNIRNRDGSTPLHTAAEYGSIHCLEYLLKSSKANPMERNMVNNWVPLHEAAFRDHYTCVNALLNVGVPDKPRTVENQTPLDLAIESNCKKTIQILKNYVPPEPKLKIEEYLHESSVTREIAKQILESASRREENGCYLIRRTQRNENILVLSLIFNGEFFNYEICIREPTSSSQKLYFIDDGPYFRQLSHLVEHYSKYEDGLPGLLLKPIRPNMGLFSQPIQHHNQLMMPGGTSQPVLSFPATTNEFIRNSSIKSSQSSSVKSSTNSHVNHSSSSSSSSSSSVSNASSSQALILNQLIKATNLNGNGTTSVNGNGLKASDALARANLFKSRTLLNDQKRTSSSQLSKKLSRISINEVQLQAIIGEGEFGTVYKGTYNGRQVAVKKLKDCTASNDFMREADIMGTLNNPCILRIFGLVQDKSSGLMMVQELMICSVLEKLWQSPNEVTENHLKLWASQIALGMQHMEEQKIVHRDLAARNVLLASMHQIKISDFGLSRSCDALTNAYTQTTEGKIPIKWYAPESIEHLKFTSKSDVWSYGVTLWEMFSYGDQPYGNKNGSEVYSYIQAGNRLQKPSSCPKNTYKIMLQCWEWAEEKRPLFRELNQFFQNDSDYQKTLPILKAFR